MTIHTGTKTMESLHERIKMAKVAFSARRVDMSTCKTLLHDHTPQVGDLVLARVEEIGQHQRLELCNGRRARMFVGNEIVVAYGNRYAPDQFEAVIPESLAPCHLVAAGGVAAQMLSKHAKMKRPTLISPVGLLADDRGNPVNLARFALPEVPSIGTRPLTLAVVGTSMNAGKTTTAASMVKGLTSSGLRVGAAKVTGTGAGGDYWYMLDSGADPVLDFTDAGVPSTYLIPMVQVEEILERLTDNLASRSVEVIVLEIADGLYQEETARLLNSRVMAKRVDGLVFTAGDAMGGTAGVAWLRKQQVPVVALSGALTRSPLAIREAEKALEIPVLTKTDLTSPTVTGYLRTWFPDQVFHKLPARESMAA